MQILWLTGECPRIDKNQSFGTLFIADIEAYVVSFQNDRGSKPIRDRHTKWKELNLNWWINGINGCSNKMWQDSIVEAIFKKIKIGVTQMDIITNMQMLRSMFGFSWCCFILKSNLLKYKINAFSLSWWQNWKTIFKIYWWHKCQFILKMKL